ncbi:MAG: glycosyltransferase family 4 protein [Actinobacteria bacterium]|nr:glycosyltransferase family 4 protein [Actinomycetota bacterium]
MPRRIVYLQDTLMSGGASRILLEILKNVDRERFFLEVATLWEEGPLAEGVRELGVPVHVLGAPRLRADRAVVGSVGGLLAARQPDLLHTSRHWSAVAGRLAARRAGIPVVNHVVQERPDRRIDAEAIAAGGTIPRNRGRLLILSHATAPLAHRFVAISQAVARRPFGVPGVLRGRMRVVYPGQDREELLRLARAEPDPPVPPDGEPAIVVVAQLTQTKGHRHLIDAMPRVQERFPGARLLVLGDGPMRSALEAQARPLGDAVAFLGYRPDRLAIMSRSDVAVFPSVTESFGIAMVEAMVVGTPVVASDIPSFREIAGGGRAAVLTRPGDPDALAAAIVGLAGDPAGAEELRATAAERAGRFASSSTTAEIEGIWEEVLTRRPRRRPSPSPGGPSG